MLDWDTLIYSGGYEIAPDYPGAEDYVLVTQILKRVKD